MSEVDSRDLRFQRHSASERLTPGIVKEALADRKPNESSFSPTRLFSAWASSSAAPLTAPSSESELIEDRAPALPDVAQGQPSGHLLKRSMDIVGSLLGLLFLGPLMLIVALGILAFDGGPVIFAQDRIGFGGRTFRIYKFRSMNAKANDALTSLLANDSSHSLEWAIRQKLVRDPRVTRLGRFLRLSSIDELPQLINVLKGDMSLIGPRPIVDNERPRYGRYFSHYCSVRPGITGLWQVSGRNDTTYRRRVALDVAYTRHVSFAVDLRILLLTIPALFGAKGCY